MGIPEHLELVAIHDENRARLDELTANGVSRRGAETPLAREAAKREAIVVLLKPAAADPYGWLSSASRYASGEATSLEGLIQELADVSVRILDASECMRRSSTAMFEIALSKDARDELEVDAMSQRELLDNLRAEERTHARVLRREITQRVGDVAALPLADAA